MKFWYAHVFFPALFISGIVFFTIKYLRIRVTKKLSFFLF